MTRRTKALAATPGLLLLIWPERCHAPGDFQRNGNYATDIRLRLLLDSRVLCSPVRLQRLNHVEDL